jgi:hypothetical protein
LIAKFFGGFVCVVTLHWWFCVHDKWTKILRRQKSLLSYTKRGSQLWTSL